MSIRVPDFSKTRVLVVGDVMLDRYWSGDANRVSPEAPVPVIIVKNREDRLGGAANVAANLRSLGVTVGLLGMLGQDEAGESIEKLLKHNQIKSFCIHHENVETITKLRVLSQQQQMLRMDFEEPIQQTLISEIQKSFVQVINDYDVVIFSDYAKGALSGVQDLIVLAKSSNKLIIVDPKGSDFSRYKNADVITPNQKEFETIVGQCDSESRFSERATVLRKSLEVKNLLITRGNKGMFLKTANAEHKVSAVAKDVHDVTGAGDTVIAVLAASLGVGETIVDAVELSNIAAGVVVGKVGTSTVSTHELRQALHTRGIGGRASHNVDELRQLVQQLQLQKKVIVMTNGCFDILHAGHIAFLEEAKAQGDYLLVAVNDDASVTRLKGAERPVNQLQDRMAVLAALSAVDWVIDFSQDTPQSLIAAILPDVLVKGGDYEIDQIAGGKEVIEAGGDVRILTYHQGRSTTRIIDQIRKKN